MSASLRLYLAEVIGTFLLVLFGTGSVAAAVLTNAQVGLWQVAVVWGFGITLAIYAAAAVSGAHLNPAVTLAVAIFRSEDFSRRSLLPYWAAQLVGGLLGGLVVLLTFGPLIDGEAAWLTVRRAGPVTEAEPTLGAIAIDHQR